MLGYAVGQHLVKNADRFEPSLSLRDDRHNYSQYCHFKFNAEQFLEDQSHLETGFDYVINCVGAIKQRTWSREQLIKINSLFPLKLAEYCNTHGMRLIHVTTDCVYSGKKGNYSELDTPDPADDYGYTKLLGEPDDCLTLRTSFIGDELHGGYSLLEWAKRHKNQKVSGYANHFWNGLTTKAFAEACDRIISNDLYEIGTWHIFNPTPLSKFMMLNAFNTKFDLNLDVEIFNAPVMVDRTLSTVHDFNAKLKIPPFHEMLKAL